MNKTRRKQIEAVRTILSTALETLEGLRDDEEDAFDNLPESIRESERGETMQEAVDNLYDACDSLEEAIDSLDSVL